MRQEVDLTNDQRQRCEEVHRRYQLKNPTFCYHSLQSDSGYCDNAPLKYRLTAYPMSAAVPAKRFTESDTIEGAIEAAEREMGVRP